MIGLRIVDLKESMLQYKLFSFSIVKDNRNSMLIEDQS